MQWGRNTVGRLERLGASIEEGCEVSLHTNQMEIPPEEQLSQQGVHREPNAYRSMRDHIHPPRVSAPSCILPPVEDVAVRPYLVPFLQTFHGMENENPYTHIRDFEKVYTTFKDFDRHRPPVNKKWGIFFTIRGNGNESQAIFFD